MLLPNISIKLTFGAGGFAVLGLFLSGIAPHSPITGPHVVGFAAASLGPALLLIAAQSRFQSSRQMLIQRIAVLWYLIAYLAAIVFAIHAGLGKPGLFFLVCALIGVGPCVVALSRWRSHET